jgi:hypothetical protein
LLVLAAAVLGSVAAARAPEYDEAYSIFLTAGDARPVWPAGLFTPAQVRGDYRGDAGFAAIARDLRRGDVHPPLYFWTLEVWRRAVGPGWLAARLLSVGFAVAALGALAWVARMAGVAAPAAVGLALFSYGFAYTGVVARGFALAQLLNVCGVGLVFAVGHARDAPRNDAVRALGAGVALGAAGFANYLAVFVGVAALAWLGVRRRWAAWPAALGFAVFLPADAWFFVGQRNSRAGQFAAFSWPHALRLLAKDGGAAWFGGLPVYAGAAGPAVAVALLGVALACLWFVALRWRAEWWLVAAAVAATPVGLLALGVGFGNTPIEIRYLAFSLPFWAVLVAGAAPRWLRGVVLAVELCGVAGLAFAPATMQPQGVAARAAARLGPGVLVLVPFGNDGVGVPGPFLAAAPDDMEVELLRGEVPDVAGYRRVAVAAVGVDAGSRAQVKAALAAFAGDCWARSGTQPVPLFTQVCRAR